MGQLEPQLRAVLRGRLKHFLRERRLTSVLVTHDQTEANALADRIAVMEDGVLQQYATPLDLKERPANLYVGTFIGEPPMNVFMARPKVAGERVELALENGAGLALAYPASDIPPAIRDLLARRDRIALGVRPHAIHLAEHGVAAQVVSNQWLGDQSHIAAEVAGLMVVAVAHRRVAARIGEPVAFSVAAQDLHLFDADSGAALAHGGVLA
jgi:multiple sugar transport system ATP-binding protein